MVGGVERDEEGDFVFALGNAGFDAAETDVVGVEALVYGCFFAAAVVVQVCGYGVDFAEAAVVVEGEAAFTCGGSAAVRGTEG